MIRNAFHAGRSARRIATPILAVACFGAFVAAAPSPMPEQTAVPAVATAEIVPMPARWSGDSARQLLGIVEAARAEGLNPRDYGPGELRRAIAGGEGGVLDAAADATASALAHDYYFGRVSDRGAGWMIRRSPYESAQLREALQAAVRSGGLDRFFAGLLPADARYAALREALAQATDGAERDRLRANLERARWMPRRIDASYIYVNVPSYRLAVVNDGQAVSTYTVVVGARDTPTPQMISPTSSLVVNPWWNVPQSIVRKSNMRPGRGGFQFTAMNGGWQVRQPPGPRNALGRIKFNLVNDQAIYMHDTPAKAGFTRDARALSHGCVRVQDIDRLAAELMTDDEGRLDEALARKDTATLRLPRTWPVYIVYFTADVDETGSVVAYDDPYGYDARVIAALDGRSMQIASR